jgi:very-short-patch-repair endonuclease
MVESGGQSAPSPSVTDRAGSGEIKSIGDRRAALVSPTVRLVEFLRTLAQVRQQRVLDVNDYELVLWLADLPPEVRIHAESGPGEAIFSVDPVVSEPRPEPPDELIPHLDFDAIGDSSLEEPSLLPTDDRSPHPDEVLVAFHEWLDSWKIWAEHDRRIAPMRELYDELARTAHVLEQQGDEFELVVAAGLISWSAPSGDRIRNHLLSTRAQLVTDRATGRIDVRVAPDTVTRIADRDLLRSQEGFNAGRAQDIRESLRKEPARPLGDATKDLLSRWRELSLERCHPYDHTWDPTTRTTPAADLRYAPALVLRRRDRSTLIEYYERMLEALNGAGADAPLGLAQLLTALDPAERMEWLNAEGAASGELVGSDPLFPLPANPEQQEIINRLRIDNGVVVQGPPGTGKTHTIANLISALLARGQRVLVTSQKAQALRVLHQKLPPEIQELCVSMTDLTRGGSQELNRSVSALSARFHDFNAKVHADTIAELEDRRERQRRRVADLTERIRSLREAETYEHPEIAPGYSGTRARIGERLHAMRARCDWMPTPLPADAAPTPPLSVEEAGELRRLLTTATPRRKARARQKLPSLAAITSAPTIEGLVADEAAAAAHAADIATDLSRELERLAAAPIDRIAGALDRVDAALHVLELSEADISPDAEKWRGRAVAAVFSHSELTVWEQLHQVADKARVAHEQLMAAGLRDIELPTFEPSGPNSLAAQLATGQALRAHLASGKQLKRRMRPAVQKAAGYLLDGARVDGVPITSVQLLDLVIAQMQAEQTAQMLAQRWAIVGHAIDPELPLVRRLGLLIDAATALTWITELVRACAEVERALADAGVRVRLSTPAEWASFRAALRAVRARLEAEAATRAIAEQISAIELLARDPDAPPEIDEIISALRSRDVQRYGELLAALADAQVEQAEQRRCDDLYRRLHAAHPGLAQLLERTARDEVWEERLAVLPEAWAWAKAATFFEAAREPGLEARLDAELRDATDRLRQVTAELAAARAWGHCLTRMTAAHAQALRSYRNAVTDRGKGTGFYASQYEAAARQAMIEARGAVPAWIMPLPEVLDTIPPDRNSFDVVIVDEASQASIEALFLLWLAPRVIVVGDDRQCTPSQVSHGALQPIFDKLEEYLPDVPHYLRVAFTPRSSLFSLLSTRFGTVIRLREHFRCMPEIIGWSSRQFYSDSPLVPLRQYGADRLPPLQCRYVPGAVTEGSGSTLRNRAEAEAIVEQLVACLKDPAYGDRTLGVVVLQGTAQVGLIDDLILQRVPVSEIERRRLRVGTPPDFQGDERSVMFLSMVVADRPQAATRMEVQRRFNVAASRAQDQMWLYHSVTPDLLSPLDLRRSLLTYMLNPPAPDAVDGLDDVNERDPHPAFDSLFEQRVFLRIRDRGYHVIPQVEVNGRRIDLVVIGAKGRLAVECDGEAWHTTPSQRAADLDRELQLKRAGWRFWRVRESEFYFNPDAALEPLWETLEARGIRPHEFTPASSEHAAEGWTPASLSDEEGLEDDGLLPDPAEATFSTPRSSATRRDPFVSQAACIVERRSSDDHRVSTAEVRAWARAHGLRVGERGRLHPEVIGAWNRAHPERRYTT